MGTRGPIPKREDERIRRNKDESGPAETISVIGAVQIPELGDISHLGETHPLVIDLYDSIKESANVKFYEPTDWQTARFTLYAMNEELINAKHQGKPMGAMKLTAISQLMSTLLLTEGERRRSRIEIERTSGEETGQVLDVADMFRQRLGG